jgi:uncharacterized protein YndB with AHSA1/START domain
MTQTADTAVRCEIVVEAPIERAYHAFTHEMVDWWDPTHHILEGELADMIVEPRVGGHIFDRGVDGSECRWATVIAYDPPHRFAFSWNITTEWKLETDPEKTSEVEISFTEDGPDRPRGALEHRHSERHGDGWEGMSSALGSGWPTGLERFAGYLSGSGPGTAA